MDRPYKTIVVENDLKQLNGLCKLLESDDYKDLFFVAKKTSFFNDAVIALQKDKFDLAIFDIYLDQSNDCYGLIEKVGRNRFTILAVATDKTSVDPKKAHTVKEPVIFFEKPYTDNLPQFIRDLNDKVDGLNKKDPASHEQNIETSVHELMTMIKKLLDRQAETPFGISTSNGNRFISTRNIYCVVAANKKTEFFVYDEKRNDLSNKYIHIVSNESFSSVINRLNEVDSLMFLQCERSYIVNVKHVIEAAKSETEEEKNIGKSGVLFIAHPNCPQIPYSGSFKDALIKRLSAKKM